MARPMQVLWYINPNDGPFPWSPEGRWTPDLMRSREIAVSVDQRGFYGALVVGRNPLVETASWISVTEQMRFLIPTYPGVTPPSMMVQQAKLFDSVSGGRLLINQVNGTDQILAHHGIDVGSDKRYAMSAEYWAIFKKLYAGEITSFEGEYFKFADPPFNRSPTQTGVMIRDPHTPVWGSGGSPAGIQHAGKVLDVYLSYLHRPDRLGAQLEAVRASAREHGRTIKAGVLCNIIVRKTEDEAWQQAERVLEQTGAEHIAWQINARLKTGRYDPARGTRDDGTLHELTSDDPRIKSRLDALKAGRLPDVRSLEGYPNIWSGPGSWSAVDVLDQGWGGYFVGSAENVAGRMRELQDELGIDAFILAGWPSLTEANTVADLLLPLLDLDQEPPKLRIAKATD